MSKPVDHEMMRKKLMRAAVCTVAECGMEGATSKKTALASELNESYIFRYFLDLKDLREKAFYAVLNEWLVECELDEGKTEEDILENFWQYLNANIEEVYFITRYITSAEFTADKRDFADSVIRNTPHPVGLFAMNLGNFAYLSSVIMSLSQGILPDAEGVKTSVFHFLIKQF